jgi:tetratricopeptide (TPR) repeat protein
VFKGPERTKKLSQIRAALTESRLKKLLFASGLVLLFLVIGLVFIALRDDGTPGGYAVLQRMKNTFSFAVLRNQPHFYALMGEKNGQDLRLTAKDTVELTYRDEFVIKKIESDAFFERGITVDVDGLGRRNVMKQLIRGIELVDRVIGQNQAVRETQPYTNITMNIRYNDQVIAVLPIRVRITPQDWLRYARSSDNRKHQIEYLRRAAGMNREDVSVRKMLAALYLKESMTDEAIDLYQQVIHLKPSDSSALRELSLCYLHKRDSANAIRVATQAIKADPTDAAALAALAMAYGLSGNWKQAVANYRESHKLAPNDAVVQFKLGEAYERIGNVAQAMEEYRSVLAKKPDLPSAMIALADASLKAGNYDESIRWYREIIRRQPSNAAAYANIGLAYGGRNLRREEIENYRSALKLNPHDTITRFNLAVAYEKENQDQNAQEEYLQVLKQRPGDLDAASRLANIYFNHKRYDQAIRIYERIVKGSPKKASIYANLGFAYGELKKYKSSAENYEKALSSGNKDPQVRYNLAATYDKLKRTNQSINAYEKLAAVQPTVEILNILAQHYVSEKHYEKAIQTYRKLINLEPRKATHYINLGQIYGLMGDVDKEIIAYKSALKKDAEDDGAHLNLGVAYEKKALYQEALEAYSRAYELNPDLENAARRIARLKIRIIEQKHKD